jgi:hypothetical protein
MVAWAVECREQNIRLDGPNIRQKALELAQSLNMLDFKASNGWLDGFQKRHQTTLRSISTVDLKSCSFCTKVHQTKHLKHVSSKANFKLKEAFKIEVDSLKFSEICRKCEEKLEVSWKFYEQVMAAQGMENIGFEEDVEEQFESVNVKIEVDDDVEIDQIPEYLEDEETFETDYKGIEVKEELNLEEALECIRKVEVEEEFLEERLELEPSLELEPPKKKAKMNPPQLKKPASVRKVKRSMELKDVRGKAFRCISMVDVFEKEINDGTYFEPPEILESLDENPRLWSDFIWTCVECQENFANILELEAHCRNKHRRPNTRYHSVLSTCRECQKETFGYTNCLNHAIEHHKNLKFCCIVCSEYHDNFMDLHNHHQAAHSSYKIVFCLYCGLHSKWGSSLKMHMAMAHNRQEFADQYECDICGKKINFRMNLTSHILTHKTPDIPCHLW